MALSLKSLSGETDTTTGPWVIVVPVENDSGVIGYGVFGLYDDEETAHAEINRLEAAGYAELEAALVRTAPST